MAEATGRQQSSVLTDVGEADVAARAAPHQGVEPDHPVGCRRRASPGIRAFGPTVDVVPMTAPHSSAATRAPSVWKGASRQASSANPSTGARTPQALRHANELLALQAKERTQRLIAEDALAKLEASYRTTVRALAAALELRDDETADHAERVAELAMRLTNEVAPELVNEPQLEYGFLLHDLGKIGIPDAILRKPGKLTPKERAEMRSHPVLGEQLIARIPFLDGLARQVIAAHHEWWDGTGYPRQLAGEDIPLAARIFAVADAFDAMTYDRPYREALPVDAAIGAIEFAAGTQFDPAVVKALAPLVSGLRNAA
jgi:HD-GYP domain-containing protein (c-di-GMP phosphodiesterase class II)